MLPLQKPTIQPTKSSPARQSNLSSWAKTFAGVIVATSMLTACQSSPFKKDPVPEPIYVPNLVMGDVQTLSIAPNKVPCNTALPMLCLVAAQPAGEAFQIPYDWVEGFNHTNGVRYVIEAQPKIDTNKSNEMTGHWVLKRVVSQQVMR